jgi:hypothetical protein
MFDEDDWDRAQHKLESATDRSFHMVEEAIQQVLPVKHSAQPIRPRHVTAISVVASDGGHNMLEAYNFLPLGAIRVVDSNGRQLFFDVIGPQDDTDELSAWHRDKQTALGKLMADLNVDTLSQLSPMIPAKPEKPGWMTVYRDLCEWAAIYDLVCNKDHVADTLVLRDGLLRSKIFSGTKFVELGQKIKVRIEQVRRTDKRRIYLVGLAKTTEVLIRYGVALEMVDAFPEGSSWFVPIPHDLQEAVYVWPEYIRLPEQVAQHGVGSHSTEDPKFNIGDMHFVRFGKHRSDPVWTVDTLWFQKDEAGQILGSLLKDTEMAFPIPAYPMSLQNADRDAQITGFDHDMLHKQLIEAIRKRLRPDQQAVLDALPLAQNVAIRRYAR